MNKSRYTDWFRQIRLAHRMVQCENNARQALRQAPNNFGIVCPNYLYWARVYLNDAKCCEPLPLP